MHYNIEPQNFAALQQNIHIARNEKYFCEIDEVSLLPSLSGMEKTLYQGLKHLWIPAGIYSQKLIVV